MSKLGVYFLFTRIYTFRLEETFLHLEGMLSFGGDLFYVWRGYVFRLEGTFFTFGGDMFFVWRGPFFAFEGDMFFVWRGLI